VRVQEFAILLSHSIKMGSIVETTYLYNCC
jgi:hypothetical protein